MLQAILLVGSALDWQRGFLLQSLTLLEERRQRSRRVASPEALFDRDSSLLVSRGLYVLRYEAGGESHDHPVAMVKPAAGFEKIIQVISAPGGVEGWLERPGAAVLVRAEDNGKIQIAAQAERLEWLARRGVST